MSRVFPWWGTVNNSHKIDTLHTRLENLTSIGEEGFSALPPFIVATRNMLLQHQMALDLLFASQGGLCHVIGESCCTIIPDTSGNVSQMVQHLNQFLADLKADEVAESTGWNWRSWLTGGVWQSWLARIIVPLVCIFVVILFCSCCVVPLIKQCINSMFTTVFIQHAQQYALLPVTDPIALSDLPPHRPLNPLNSYSRF